MLPKHATNRSHCGNMSMNLSTCRKKLNTFNFFRHGARRVTETRDMSPKQMSTLTTF